MALTPPVLYADLVSARSSGAFAFSGIPFDQLAMAVAYAMAAWFPLQGVRLKGTCVGTAGAGAINTPVSRLFLVPNPSLVIGGLTSAGMSGPLSVSLGTVISSGIAKSVTSYGQYAGGVSGVGVGGDVSKAVSSNGSLLVSQLSSFLSAMMGSGPAMSQMAAGLGAGIAALVLGITGTGTVIGTSSVSPATGQSNSWVV